MLRAIRRFFEDQLSSATGADPSRPSGHTLQLATAALAIETIRADRSVTEDERQTLFDVLANFLELTAAETAELIGLAEKEADEGVSLYQFTNLIDNHYPIEQKIEIVELLWRISYADGRKDDHEEHLVRKVAHLLHVPHQAFIRGKLKAEAALAKAAGTP